MILGVFGPRNFNTTDKADVYNNYTYIAEILDEYDATKIVSGGGLGVEQLALRYAGYRKLAHQVVPPNIATYGQSDAFSVRNREIIVICDMIVVFWDGKDKFYHQLMADAVSKKTLLHLRHVE